MTKYIRKAKTSRLTWSHKRCLHSIKTKFILTKKDPNKLSLNLTLYSNQRAKNGNNLKIAKKVMKKRKKLRTMNQK